MDDVLFLACFLGIPVLMVLAIVWLIIRALRARFAFAGALRAGWTEVPREAIDERLGELPPLHLAGRVRVDRCARAEDPTRMICRYRWSSRGVPETRQGRQEAWLIVPVDTPVPRAMIQARAVPAVRPQSSLCLPDCSRRSPTAEESGVKYPGVMGVALGEGWPSGWSLAQRTHRPGRDHWRGSWLRSSSHRS